MRILAIVYAITVAALIWVSMYVDRPGGISPDHDPSPRPPRLTPEPRTSQDILLDRAADAGGEVDLDS